MFYFYDIILLTKKISAYQEFDMILVIDEFQRVSSIGYQDMGLDS